MSRCHWRNHAGRRRPSSSPLHINGLLPLVPLPTSRDALHGPAKKAMPSSWAASWKRRYILRQQINLRPAAATPNRHASSLLYQLGSSSRRHLPAPERSQKVTRSRQRHPLETDFKPAHPPRSFPSPTSPALLQPSWPCSLPYTQARRLLFVSPHSNGPESSRQNCKHATQRCTPRHSAVAPIGADLSARMDSRSVPR